MDVSVVIPSHHARVVNGMTKRAVGSVLMQSYPVSSVIVEIDKYREGAAVTRNRGLQRVTTDWVAFLDSDDQLKKNHLEVLVHGAQATGADYLYTWYDPIGFSRDPLPHFGKVFDPENPTQTTITTLVRTELAQEVGFRNVEPGKLIDGQRYGEDFQFTVEVIAKGGKIVHIPQRTWLWNAHGFNTSGLPTAGDARL
jgi:glycosyltransferase involved in cell wall biosynthesis